MRWNKFLPWACVAFLILLILFIAAPTVWAGSTIKTLHTFHGKDGASPGGYLIFDAAGNLYGTTYSGGKYNSNCPTGSCGTVFEVIANSDGTWTHKILHYFTANEDNNPDAGVIFDSAGNLYGMTNNGPDAGDVYELTPNADGSWNETVLHKFGGAYNGNPQGGMIFDASGNLYGTGAWGCGTDGVSCVFEMTPSGSSWTFNSLYGFNFTGSTGWYPSGTTPVFDANGNLYATTAFGGNSGCSPYGNGCYGLGVVFELLPNGDGTWSIKDLHKFTGSWDGESPACPLVFDQAGNLYGTTFAGGTHGDGNVFELTPNADGTWTAHVLHQFTGGNDGSAPSTGVILDAAGNLYGTTTKGGAFGYGVVYKLTLTTSGWHETVLEAFTNNPGSYPSSGLVFDGAGNLYGTTSGDGTTTFGTVFEITQ